MLSFICGEKVLELRSMIDSICIERAVELFSSLDKMPLPVLDPTPKRIGPKKIEVAWVTFSHQFRKRIRGRSGCSHVIPCPRHTNCNFKMCKDMLTGHLRELGLQKRRKSRVVPTD